MIIPVELPEAQNLQIKEGDVLEIGSPLLETTSLSDITIPLSSMLRMPSNQIFQHLKKFVGENLKKDELVAEYKSMLSIKKYYSEYDGVLKQINHVEGSIMIEIVSQEANMLQSWFKGAISKIEGNRLFLEVEAGEQFELKEASSAFGGQMFSYNPNQTIVTEDDVSNKVALMKSIPAYEQVKLETLGVNGFITLHRLQDTSSTPYALLKNVPDFEHIIEIGYPYCIINHRDNLIYIYQ
ncbi:MAG: hypothetical protein WCO06_02255 [Candidatus Roizmanbacteria bacterium]